MHRRVIRREADGARILGEVVQAQRLSPRGSDAPRMPRPRGSSPIAACVSASIPCVRNRSSREPARVDHAERGIAGAGELGGRLDEPLQQRVERQLGGQRDAGLEQRLQAHVAAADGLHGPTVTLARRRGCGKAAAPFRVHADEGPTHLEHAGGEARRCTMFDKVIWATDGSEFADEALPFAKRLAAGDGRELVIVHSTERLVGGRSAGEPLRADEDDVELKILKQVEEARAEGLNVITKFSSSFTGHTADVISELARELGADVIVVGTRGYGPSWACLSAASRSGSCIPLRAPCSRCRQAPRSAAAMPATRRRRRASGGSRSGSGSGRSSRRDPSGRRDAPPSAAGHRRRRGAPGVLRGSLGPQPLSALPRRAPRGTRSRRPGARPRLGRDRRARRHARRPHRGAGELCASAQP